MERKRARDGYDTACLAATCAVLSACARRSGGIAVGGAVIGGAVERATPQLKETVMTRRKRKTSMRTSTCSVRILAPMLPLRGRARPSEPDLYFGSHYVHGADAITEGTAFGNLVVGCVLCRPPAALQAVL